MAGIGPRKKAPLPKAMVGRGGGVGIAGPGQGPTAGQAAQGPAYVAPPFLGYDPAIEAERQAAHRGLEDVETETRNKQHFGEQDLASALRNIKTETARKRGTINRDSFRAERKFDYEEEDLGRKGARQKEDFGTQLANIGRQFAQLGHRQTEAANAAGVVDQGTLAASGAARAGNQKLAEAPIHTAEGRLNEDLATALGRLGTGRSDLEGDTTRALTHLKQDRDVTRQLTKRKAYREIGAPGPDGFIGTLAQTQEKARREATITDSDKLAQEIYAARAEHPAIYRQWAKEHPDVVAELEGRPTTNKSKGGNPKSGVGGGGAATGGTSPPNKRKRR